MLTCELLETREVPATVTLTGGTLAVLGDQVNDVVDVFVSLQDPTQIVANVNGVRQTFSAAAVTQVFLDGQGGDDALTSQVPGVIDILRGGTGNDSLQAFGRTSVVFGGSGNDLIYAIVGAGAVLDGEQGKDRVIGNATSIIIPDPADLNSVVFGVATAPFQVVNGVLILVGTAGNDSGSLTQQGNTLTLVYNGVTTTLARNSIDAIAAVFGAGDDSFANFTSVDQIMYGAAGNDTLVGGGGFNLLKGGSGNDLLVGGRSSNDLTGDAGFDTLIGGSGNDILRVINDGDVFVASGGDLIIQRF